MSLGRTFTFAKHYFYRFRSTVDEHQTISGLSADPEDLLRQHNKGLFAETEKLRPFIMEALFWFADPRRAYVLERYVKSARNKSFKKQVLDLDITLPAGPDTKLHKSPEAD